MKNIIAILLVSSFLVKAQTITFKGCTNLFDNQEFVFNKTGTDATGRNIFVTTPIIPPQDCSGLGTCEFKIQWSSAGNRWEFLADEGDGTFSSPLVIFSNSANSSPNPPDLTLGVWNENSFVTGDLCGGPLTTSNATLTGAVQSSVLNVENFNALDLNVYPNPVKDLLYFQGKIRVERVEIYSLKGQKVKDMVITSNSVNLRELSRGVYLLKLYTETGQKTFKIIKD